MLSTTEHAGSLRLRNVLGLSWICRDCCQPSGPSMPWNSLKEDPRIFLIFQNSHHELECLFPGKGSLLGTCPGRAACPVLFPTVCSGPRPLHLPPPPPIHSPSPWHPCGTSHPDLSGMKSFKMVSQNGENTCF